MPSDRFPQSFARHDTGGCAGRGTVKTMLLPYLNPAAPDAADALRIGDDSLSREDLVGVATAVAERIAGARVVAVLARPTSETVLAVLGG